MQLCKHIAPRFVERAYAFLDVTPRHGSCRDVSVAWDVYVPILGNIRIVAGHVATNCLLIFVCVYLNGVHINPNGCDHCAILT